MPNPINPQIRKDDTVFIMNSAPPTSYYPDARPTKFSARRMREHGVAIVC